MSDGATITTIRLAIPRPIGRVRRSPLTSALIAGGLTLGVLGCGVTVLLFTYRASLQRELTAGLMRSAQVVAGMIDPEEHRRITTQESVSVADYNRMREPLVRTLATGIDYQSIYSMILRPGTDGKDHLFLILDTAQDGERFDQDGDGVLRGTELAIEYDMGEYYDAPDTVRQTLLKGLAIPTDEPFEDTYGVFMSAFCPLLAKDGTVVAAVGVDLDASPFIAQQRRIWLLYFGSLGVAALAAASVGILAWRNRRLQLQAAAETERYIVAIENAAAAARAGEKAKNDFLSLMSHELRTPLNGTLGMTDLLLESGLDEEQTEWAATSRRCGSQLLAMLSDMLDFTAIQGGTLDLKPTDFDPGMLVEDLADTFASEAADKGIALTTVLDRRLPRRLRGDAGRIRQVIQYLLVNAIRFTEHGGVVVRVGWGDDNGLRIVVEDTGPGLSSGARAALFSPFAQGEELAYRKGGGLGLGLAIAGRLSHLLNGDLEVQSESGQGTAITFRLRLEPSPEDAAGHPDDDSTHPSHPWAVVPHPAVVLAISPGPVRESVVELLAAAGVTVDLLVSSVLNLPPVPPVANSAPQGSTPTPPPVALLDAASLSNEDGPDPIALESLGEQTGRSLVVLVPRRELGRWLAALGNQPARLVSLPATRARILAALFSDSEGGSGHFISTVKRETDRYVRRRPGTDSLPGNARS